MTDFSYPVRVYYDDTDAGGIVYYANYFKFAERARTEWLRGLGLQSSHMRAEHDLLIVVKTASADYKTPARLDDQLQVDTKVTAMGGSSLTLTQTVHRGDQTICIMSIVLVCIDAITGRPARWPEAMRGKIAAKI